MENVSRRKALLGAVAIAAAVSAPAVEAAPANVPVIWDGQKMWETFEKEASGFAFPCKKGAPTAYVAFDAQCPDCIRLYERVKPILNRVHLVWCPIAFLNIHSDPQGASILMAQDPAAKFVEQHDHFRDAGFRGFRYDLAKIPDEVRNRVWTNTKLHRRSGCRAVPYGVYKNSKGEYLPFDENLTTSELTRLFEL